MQRLDRLRAGQIEIVLDPSPDAPRRIGRK